jgi:heptaprenyl diphosphate synthase
MTHKHTNTKKLAFLALCLGISLVIYTIESLFPLPNLLNLPGIKLGFANIITLVLISKPRDASAVLILRIFLGSLYTATFMGFCYSLAGGLLSFFAMLIAYKFTGDKDLWFCGILGGIFHNLGQVLVAMVFLKTGYVAYYFTILTIAGIFTGFLTGYISQILVNKLKILQFYRKIK